MTDPIDAPFIEIDAMADDANVFAQVDPVCATCKWFRPDTKESVGHRCSANPVWVGVDADHTCGQWTPRVMALTPKTWVYRVLGSDLTAYTWRGK